MCPPAAAARGLKVSQRAVQRWINGTNAPRPKTSTTIATSARQAMTTRAGRARAMKAAQAGAQGSASRTASTMGMTVCGYQGVRSGGTDYLRKRECAVALTADDFASLQQTYVDHGSTGVAAWITQHMDHRYTSGWRIAQLDGLSFSSASVHND